MPWCCFTELKNGMYVNDNPIFKCIKDIGGWEYKAARGREKKKSVKGMKDKRENIAMSEVESYESAGDFAILFLSWTEESSLQPYGARSQGTSPEVYVTFVRYQGSSHVSACLVLWPESHASITAL